MLTSLLLLLIQTVSTGPLFPPQPSLPPDVILTLVEDERTEWLEELVREDTKTREAGENDTAVSVKLGTNTTDLDSLDQNGLGYFEGDIFGVGLGVGVRMLSWRRPGIGEWCFM